MGMMKTFTVYMDDYEQLIKTFGSNFEKILDSSADYKCVNGTTITIQDTHDSLDTKVYVSGQNATDDLDTIIKYGTESQKLRTKIILEYYLKKLG